MAVAGVAARAGRRLLRAPLLAALIICAATWVGIVALRSTGSLESLELAAYDWYLSAQPQPTSPDPRIVLITIDENDIQAEGRWPVSDATLARALERLALQEPRAIGLDIYRDVPVPPGREELDRVLLRYPMIVGTMKIGEGVAPGVAPPPVLARTDRVGFNDIVVDPGGTVRRGLLFMDHGGGSAYSFALRLALLYLKADGIVAQPDPANPALLRLRRTTLHPFEANDGGYVRADARGYQLLLDYSGGRHPFTSFPLTALLGGRIAPEAVRGKVVLVGVTAEAVKDFFYTPYSRSLREAQQLSGIALHAHAVSQLLRSAVQGERPMTAPADWQEHLWSAVWSALGGLIGLKIRSPWRFSVSVAAGLVTLGLLDFAAFAGRWWVPLVPPALAWVVSAAVVTAHMSAQENAQRAILMQLFSQHVSPEVADTIWAERDQFLDGRRPRSQRLIATVLFTDLKGFTGLSERLSPPDLVEWLNEYLDAMAPQVIHHRGVINKYAGDSIMATFGVPLPRRTEAEVAQDARHAVGCALAMAGALRELNDRWRAEGRPTAAMRIGIFSGPVVAGSIGSTRRLEYTVIGDAVNIAARLESYDKAGFLPDGGSPCRILIGDSTRQHLGEQFTVEPVGEVALEGKAERVSVYRVLAESLHASTSGGTAMISVTRAAGLALAGVAMLVATLAGAAEGQSPPSPRLEAPDQPAPPPRDAPVYAPPSRGAPGGRVGGGTRGSVRAATTLSVLAPDHTGLTLDEQPVLYWFLSGPVSGPVELTVTDRQSVRPLLETRLPPPARAGIHEIRLADHGVRLSPNASYRWYVTMVVDPDRRSKDIVAGGSIERVAPPDGLLGRLAKAERLGASYVYAEAGLWYDALRAISELIEASASEPSLHRLRASLLEQVGLRDAAEHDLRVTRR